MTINPWVGGLLFCLTDHFLGCEKMSQSVHFVTIQVLKNVIELPQLQYVHPQSWVDIKSLAVLSGDETSQRM